MEDLSYNSLSYCTSWVSLLLATSHTHQEPPEALIGRIRSPRVVRGRSALCGAWVAATDDRELATAWLQTVLRSSDRTIQRRIEEAEPADVAVALDGARILRPHLLQAHVHDAIAAGWLGHGKRGVNGLRGAVRLLRLAQAQLPTPAHCARVPSSVAE